jgi:succinate dehydrogenase/fumarate reductase flavoprotein subunit
MVWGLIVGDHMREKVPDLKRPVFGPAQLKQISVEKKRVMAPLGRAEGIDALELEHYVRNINMNYINVRKVEPKLKRARELFELVRQKAVPALGAGNPHELMRALEVQDIIDLSEVHAQASLERTESRMAPSHYRLDYPRPDDANWAGLVLTAQMVDGKAKYVREKMA